MTTIVASRTDTEIVVGADSKVTWARDGLREVDCKIYQVGKVFFALAGIGGDAGTDFSVAEIVKQVASSRGRLEEIVRTCELMIQSPLYATIEGMKIQHPEFFERHLSQGSYLDIVFFGFENGLAAMYLQSYWADKIESKGFRGRFDFTFLGYWKPLAQFIETRHDYWNIGITAATRNLIQMAIDDNPDLVGPPISIIRITADGAEWVQKSPQCPELET